MQNNFINNFNTLTIDNYSRNSSMTYYQRHPELLNPIDTIKTIVYQTAEPPPLVPSDQLPPPQSPFKSKLKTLKRQTPNWAENWKSELPPTFASKSSQNHSICKNFSFEEIQSELANCEKKNVTEKKPFSKGRRGVLASIPESSPWADNPMLNEHQQLTVSILQKDYEHRRETLRFSPNQHFLKITYNPITNTYHQQKTPQYQQLKKDLSTTQKELQKWRERHHLCSVNYEGEELQEKRRLYRSRINSVGTKLQGLREAKRECQKERQRVRFKNREINNYFARNRWGVFLGRYVVLELIGYGGFGEVFRGYDVEGGREVAIKLNVVERGEEEGEGAFASRVRHIEREVEIHRGLDHRRIAKYYETYKFYEQEKVFVVSTMELCSGVDLFQYIHNSYQFPVGEILSIVYQILEGLEYLRGLPQKVIHYDLKPHNILYENGEVKIIDFGLCKVMGEGEEEIELTSVGSGTMHYLPPETFPRLVEEEGDRWVRCLEGLRVSTSVDMWSVGVIFYELLYGVMPFGEGVEAGEIWRTGVMREELEVGFPRRGGEEVGEDVEGFIRGCWRGKEERITPGQGLRHPCFRLVQGFKGVGSEEKKSQVSLEIVGEVGEEGEERQKQSVEGRAQNNQMQKRSPGK